MKKNYLWTAVKAALILPAATLSMSSVIAQEVSANDDVEVIEVQRYCEQFKTRNVR